MESLALTRDGSDTSIQGVIAFQVSDQAPVIKPGGLSKYCGERGGICAEKVDQPRREDFGELREFTVGGSDELMGETWVGRSPKGSQDLGGAFEPFDERRHNFLTVLEVNEEIRGLTPVFFPALWEGDLASVVREGVLGGVVASWYDGGGCLRWGVLRRAVTLVAGLSKLARKCDDFFGVSPASNLTGSEGPDGGSGGSLGHDELNVDGLIPGELQIVESGEGKVGEDLSRASQVRWSNLEDRAGGGMVTSVSAA